jgi:heme/copper-type cytochrome/quinol oxidase subunit 3
MLFGGLITSFIILRLGGPGWGGESAHLSVPIAAFNTFVLLSSSMTIVQALAAAEDGHGRRARNHLAYTILLGLLFLCGKAVEYTHEINSGFTPASGLFWSFYYAMTGLHALHVLAGIVVNLIVLTGERSPRRLEAAGLYWHFVDIVWIFLLPLLYLS